MKVTLQNKSLLDIRSELPECFYIKQDAWYDSESFAKEKITGTWDVSLEPVKDSFSKTWDDQKNLLEKGDEVPPVAVLVYAMCKHFKESGERAFEDVYVRTSSIGSGGYHVVVGHFGAGGLSIFDDWGSIRIDVLGLASARKLEPCTLESLNLERAIGIVVIAGYQVSKIV